MRDDKENENSWREKMKMKKILLKKFLFVELLASQVEIVESLLHSFSRFHPVADGVNAMLAVSATFDERIAVYLIKPFPISHHQQGFVYLICLDPPTTSFQPTFRSSNNSRRKRKRLREVGMGLLDGLQRWTWIHRRNTP